MKRYFWNKFNFFSLLLFVFSATIEFMILSSAPVVASEPTLFTKEEAKDVRRQKLSESEALALLDVVRSYVNRGQFSLAIFELEKILALTEEPWVLAGAWEQWGNVHSKNGELTEAHRAYQKSLELKQSLSTMNNSIVLLQKQEQMARLKGSSSKEGKQTRRYLDEAQEYRSLALEYAQSALALARKESSSSSIRTLIEADKLQLELTDEDIKRGRFLLENLPASRNKVFLAINWAKLDPERADYWLLQGDRSARATKDVYAGSYISLQRGLLAEQSGKLEDALEFAGSAQLKAQSQLAYDSLYRASWLSGRIRRKKGQTEAAMIAYQQAIASLDEINKSSINIDIEYRINFKNQVESVYREFLRLLLEEKSSLSQSDLEYALFIKDKLQLAQLQNYFGDNCFSLQRETSTIRDVLVAKNAVLLNSIMLEDATHLILKLGNGRLFHHRVPLGESEITDLAVQWHHNLQQRDTRRFLTQSRFFYDLIIKPFHSQLQKGSPSTIIFVHDGILRNLPMAALHDGNEFLPQKWASVSSLGLRIKPARENLSQAAIFGLGESREGWSSLDNVVEEVEGVVSLTGGKIFLNREFTTERVVEELKTKDYSIVHFATHGFFGGVRENSFLLAYDRPLSALDLESFLAQSKGSIELLVLSACETSLGSDRSSLGLAGVALRSGVNSVLGSFWLVRDDEQVELMKSFYSGMREQNLALAISLQRVQQQQIEINAHPSKWAALNLIGDL